MTYTLEPTPASLHPHQPPIRWTAREREVFSLLPRLGLRYGGAVRRYRGWTLIFYHGAVGTMAVAFTCPRRGLAGCVLRHLAERRVL